MKFNNDISSSGPVSAQNVNVSNRFTDYMELPSNGYSRLFCAQRYGQKYILKGLKPEYAADPQYTAMISKEFSLMVNLTHPNIVRALIIEQDLEVGDCIVMEYVDGCTLDEFLQKNPSETVRRQIVKELLEAMAYYHRKQVVHQDLKPSNILITNDGNHVKIIDFGFADSRSFTILKEPAYTQSYAAPEQLSNGEIDNRTDLYAFGLILKQLFPTRYGNVVRKCLQPQKEKRYPLAEDVLHNIEKTDRKRKSMPFIAGAALILIGLLCAFLHPILFISNKIEEYRIRHAVDDSSPLAGALNGVFSVAPDKQVRFSQGNLQYSAAGKHQTADGLAQGTWRFAENQYDIIGEDNSSISSHFSGWIDLFGWGTSGWNSGAFCYQPWSVSVENVDYSPGNNGKNSLTNSCAFADWGVYNAISNGGNAPGRWRTLTKDEAEYLFLTRNASTVNGIPNARYAKATVNGVRGLVLFPNKYDHPNSIVPPQDINNDTVNYKNHYSAQQWKALENAGAVFLPEASVRGNLHYTGEPSGHYWTSSSYTSSCVFNIGISEFAAGVGHVYRYYGLSVRLVQDAVE